MKQYQQYTCPMHPEVIKDERKMSYLWNGLDTNDQIGGRTF